MKRILAFILATLVCFSAAFSVSATEISNKKTENKSVSLLAALDVLRGDENGDYLLDKAVNRAEFTTFVIRVMGLEQTAKNQNYVSPFIDVADEHWAKNVICMAADMGLIQGVGNGYFEPDREVTLQEAVKILVSVLGYQTIAEQNGGYPEGYSKTAMQIGLLKKLSLSGNSYLNRSDTCLLLGNALLTEVYSDAFGLTGKNALEEFLHLTTIRGTITATPGYQRDKSLNGKIELNGVVYECVDAFADDYIGYDVKAYVSDDDENVIYHIEPASAAETVTVDAEDIDPRTTTSEFIYLDEEGEDESLSLASPLSVFYNGVILSDNEVNNAALCPETGSVSLRDGDGDGSYETVLLEVYEDYVLNYINEDRLFAKFGKTLDVNNAKTMRIFKDGVEVTLEELENGDVLSVMQSRNQKVIKIVVSSEGKVGFVSMISRLGNGQEVYTLDSEENGSIKFELGKDYLAALEAKHLDAVSLSVSANRLLKIYYNAFGKVADISILSLDDDFNYGYLNGVKKLGGSGLSDRFAIQVLTTSNHFEVFESPKEKDVIFGFPTNDGGYKIASATTNMFVSSMRSKQLIRYKLDNNGYVTEIHKADPNPSQDHFSKGYILEGSNLDYRDNVIDSKYYIDYNTNVFFVMDNYMYLSGAGKYSDLMANGAKRYMELYDVKGSYVNALLLTSPVVTLADDTPGDKGYEVVIDRVNSPILYINDISQKLADDGELYTCIEGYQDGEPMSILLSETLKPNSEPASNLKPGIAIQYEDNKYLLERAETSDEPLQLVLFKTVHDFTKQQSPYIDWNYGGVKTSRAQITTLCGPVSAATENYCVVETGNEPYSFTMHQYTMFLRYDASENEFILEKIGAVNSGQNVFVRQRYQNTREVVIY